MIFDDHNGQRSCFELKFLFNAITGVILRNPEQLNIDNQLSGLNVVTSTDPLNPAYRARPLDGVWATAPFLHNGSVPNLWQLLKVPEERVATFFVGSRAFDPVNVGFEDGPDSAGTLLDTSLPGNANYGHGYGTRELTDTQKWELIEYLKSL